MNEVLVDTSVWVDHFRRNNESLVDLLSLDMAMTHPMVVTELACGTPPAPRGRTLADIAALPQSRQASLVEVRELIEREQLFGLGCGLVDLTLLASAMLTTGARLWTLDQRLRRLAERFQVAYLPTRH
jgi:predicted nucleic acid-binding protein